VLNVITGLFPPEEEPCNPFTVAIEIAEIPTPAPALRKCHSSTCSPTVIESFVVKTHAVSARSGSSMNIKHWQSPQYLRQNQ
jgi:hypothetical protein